MPCKLRMAVTSDCNMNCIYCPTDVKENYTPKEFLHYNRSLKEFQTLLSNLLSQVDFTAVSITGGEPILNKDLPAILETIHKYNPNIELNTNGVLINEKVWEKVGPFVKSVKLSMDSTNIDVFNALTGIKDRFALEKIRKTINIIKKTHTDITINTVISKVNYKELNALLDFIIDNELNLSLLDLYGTNQTKEFRLENFIPVEEVWPILESKFDTIERDDLFGCTFYRYKNKGGRSEVRTKSSLAGTTRAEKCDSCDKYCQEGIYAVKLSREGWITTCPSNDISDGTILMPEDIGEKLLYKIQPILNDVLYTKYQKNTFEKFFKLMKKNSNNGGR